jgi:hypothetical protein
MWFGIGKMCLEKNTIRCAHFTQSERDSEIESESELRALIQMRFQYPAY